MDANYIVATIVARYLLSTLIEERFSLSVLSASFNELFWLTLACSSLKRMMLYISSLFALQWPSGK